MCGPELFGSRISLIRISEAGGALGFLKCNTNWIRKLWLGPIPRAPGRGALLCARADSPGASTLDPDAGRIASSDRHRRIEAVPTTRFKSNFQTSGDNRFTLPPR